MKKHVASLTIAILSVSLSLVAGPAQASCPSGKAGNMETENVGESFEAFTWVTNVAMDMPNKVTLDFASMPIEGSSVQLSDNGTNFVTVSFATLVFDGIPYSGDQWNSFKVILNFDSDTYRASVNGQLSGSKPFDFPSSQVDAFQFTYGNPSPGSGWIDTVRLIIETGATTETIIKETFQDNSPPVAADGTLTSENPETTDPAPGANCPTRTSLSIDFRNGKIFAEGNVNPTHEGDKVIVKLFKKKNGNFVLVNTKRPFLVNPGYSTSFARPDASRCRVTTRFPGDDDHAASQKTRTFDC